MMELENGRAVELLAERLRILGQPLRIRLLNRLHQSPATVHELVDAVAGVQQNVSQHLAILHQAGIVSRSKCGARVRYELADPHVIKLLTDTYASLAWQVDALSRLIGPTEAESSDWTPAHAGVGAKGER
jgi:DNA-binding transcriptional ArsR family regulator